MADDNDDIDRILPLAMELITASRGDPEQFFTYGLRRLGEEHLSVADVYELVVVLASSAGTAIEEWAEATERTTTEVMHQIAMDMQDGDA